MSPACTGRCIVLQLECCQCEFLRRDELQACVQCMCERVSIYACLCVLLSLHVFTCLHVYACLCCVKKSSSLHACSYVSFLFYIKLIAFELAAKFSRRRENPVQPRLCNAKNAIFKRLKTGFSGFPFGRDLRRPTKTQSALCMCLPRSSKTAAVSWMCIHVYVLICVVYAAKVGIYVYVHTCIYIDIWHPCNHRVRVFTYIYIHVYTHIP